MEDDSYIIIRFTYTGERVGDIATHISVHPSVKFIQSGAGAAISHPKLAELIGHNGLIMVHLINVLFRSE